MADGARPVSAWQHYRKCGRAIKLPKPVGYVAIDPVHLERWRGHALAQFGRRDATTVLRHALERHDTEFARAEAGLRVDLVLAHIALGEDDAARHEITAACRTAEAVGSVRQQRRLARAATTLAY